MDQSQIGHIARILYRISDNDERDEVTREIAQVLEKAEPNFTQHRFYELANVAFSERGGSTLPDLYHLGPGRHMNIQKPSYCH